MMRELTVREAAEVLGVTPQRVRQLVAARSLTARRVSSGWLIPDWAVAERGGHRRPGRPVKPSTVWATLRLLAGDAVELDRRVRHRVQRLLAAMPSPRRAPRRWRALLGGRSRRVVMWAHPGVIADLVADARVSRGGAAVVVARGGEGVVGGPVDVYVAERDFVEVRDAFALRAEREGNVVVHIVTADVPDGLAPEPGHAVSAVVGAADLLDTGDPRDRAVGSAVLADAWREATAHQPTRRR